MKNVRGLDPKKVTGAAIGVMAVTALAFLVAGSIMAKKTVEVRKWSNGHDEPHFV